jgi:hypothetical protein
VWFEVVSRLGSDVRPHPEERACRRRSANSKARTRVSKDEDGRLGSPHASRRIAAHLSCGSACARRAAMLLSMRATVRGAFLAERSQAERMRVWSERSTNLRLWETIAGSAPLFPDCYLQ